MMNDLKKMLAPFSCESEHAPDPNEVIKKFSPGNSLILQYSSQERRLGFLPEFSTLCEVTVKLRFFLQLMPDCL